MGYVIKGKQYTIYGDMLKSVYDTDNDGVVDNAEKIDGRTITVSTSDPSGGSNGDLWFKYTP